ncbi:MAG: hypothetical protein H6719_37410 [Sandaracinaceae bacterium]|nr:hypothetical protein [Sandaracinaceae bacterium]
MRVTFALALLLAACEPAPSARELPRELTPAENPFGPEDGLWSPQPHRDRPYAIARAGDRLFVTLRGTEDAPGREVAVLDARTFELIGRVEVGLAPTAIAAHPDGRHLVVLNRFASHASVLDGRALEVVEEIPVPFYCEGVAFSPDGARALVTNRWKDSVLRWDVRVEGDRLVIDPVDVLTSPQAEVGVRVDADPLRVRFLDARRALVTSETSLSLTLLDAESGAILAHHVPNGPVTDVAVAGGYVLALHTGHGSGHPPDFGFDGDFDGAPGDGTANVTFQDVQNEIDVLAPDDLRLLHRYTSDTICCRDYRDVDPDHPEAGLELRPVDRWPPERVAFLPPRDTWIVAGAMPERIVPFARPTGSPAVAVVFGGSSEVQTFDLDPTDGSLTPRERAGSLFEVRFGARDAVLLEEVDRLAVVERLGESVAFVDLASGEVARTVVGDERGGAFPATDAELGEAFNTVTAPFTIDGDQSCVHCHREGTPIAKPVSMPLLEAPAWGVRNVMSYRGAFDSRPWFVEAAMEEDNFFPVINEFARRENFCCEQSDVRVWSRYPSHDECTEEPDREGCDHVLRCLESPPPECAERGYGGEALTRERHFRDAALRVFGRDESFGDGLYAERLGDDGRIERRPIRLGFDGVTRALGLFLLSRPRLLPNPNAMVPRAEAREGALLFASSRTGCASCHPLPVAATAVGGPPGPLRFSYVLTPVRGPSGADVDRVNPAFLGTFPDAVQDSVGLRVGVPSLRGIWDRRRFLHHGLARSLREAIATPHHPGLAPGERGFDERDGQADTHGSTSGLSARELDALIAFMETL